MGALEERIKLIDRILENKISKSGVEKEICRLEEEYGKEAFCVISFNKKERPWSKEYYEKLEKLSLSGESSKEYILHLVEVRDELANKGLGGIIDFLRCHKTAVVICAVVLIGVVALLCKK